MYKPLHEELRRSRKHAAASAWASTVWFLVLPQTDSEGRLLADPAFVKSTCFPFRRERFEQVEDALQELARLGLIHLYTAAGERYLVIHDHAQWVPRLKNVKPKYPMPPPDLCICLRSKRSEKEESPPFSSIQDRLQEGQERIQGKPGGETPSRELLRLVAAREFQRVNGATKALADVAEHFVSLEAAKVPADFVLAEIPKRSREAPWTCCDRIHDAWKIESERRADLDSLKTRQKQNAERTEAARAEIERPPTVEEIERRLELLRRARSNGLKIDAQLVVDLEAKLAELRAERGVRS